MNENSESRFLAEWCICEDAQEYEKGIQYLALWAYFIKKKFNDLEQVGDHSLIYRPAREDFRGTLAIKIEMKQKTENERT